MLQLSKQASTRESNVYQKAGQQADELSSLSNGRDRDKEGKTRRKEKMIRY